MKNDLVVKKFEKEARSKEFNTGANGSNNYYVNRDFS